jgi:mono/diheme cytochrome c family protein
MTSGRRLSSVFAVIVLSWASAFASVAATPATLTDTLEQRLAACAACHGKEGEGIRQNSYYPRIAGKPADYLFQQLVNFRNGKRGFPQMVYFVRHLSDAYLREIADHYAGLHPAYPPKAATAAPAALMARGEALVRRGDRAKDIPTCVACHGDALTGMLPAIPGLVGLYPDYITSQLGSWQRGIRHAAPPDCMATIASRLNGQDVVALATWLAAQPASPTALPAPQRKESLPLMCGSQQVAAPAVAPTSVSRGEYLARIGDCIACHTVRGGRPFAGGLALKTPFGTLYTPNITPDREHGIGRWSADDFWRAMHDGRSKDGSLLYPAFPYPSYTRVTRSDSDAIFEYLAGVAPAAVKNRPHEMKFPYSQRKLMLAWRALYFQPGELAPQPGESAQWNRGAYLVEGLGHCSACHTARNMLGATVKDRELAGSLIPSQDWYAPSLTSDRESGLGRWDAADIAALLRTGVSPRGAVFGPMAQVVHDGLQYLTDDDAAAMAVYLKSLAVSEGGASASPATPLEGQARASYDAGAELYDTHCKSCHRADGSGIPPAYPPLAGNASVTMESAVNPIRIVLFGGFPPATQGNPRPFGMPPFAYRLSDREVADVVTYMRRAWGNGGGGVTASEVGRFRAVPGD